MRQAGRALPEYRALRQKFSFLTLVKTPDLATEVTLQPVRRFGFDAAILFSDILVIPEAAGQPYQFRDTGGVVMDRPLRKAEDLARLRWEGLGERLDYVAQALRLLRKTLDDSTALLGFGGSPWTLANFMVEGGSSAGFRHALEWWWHDPQAFNQLMEQLTLATIQYFQLQIDAGVDAIQIFDSLAGLLESGLYEHLSARWIRRIIKCLNSQVPIIVFAKGHHGPWDDVLATNPQVISFDATVNLGQVRAVIPENIAMQGNLDTGAMTSTPDVVRTETCRILTEMNGRKGYIFNLGHGLPAGTPIENISTLVDTIAQFKWVN
jgi:uroporphyrinogen decarboxylase